MMPELGEQMYCSEQICIPPAFPYLLRQFAKAAIRTQPTDLLRWSTAYFRCLSLNIPPPVKPRLEYPIPKDHCGVTPGWLKALMYQLQNNLTVPFRILWDRWTGACLEHDTLVQILCLGGFTDPEAIPWLKFIALCAAHLTDDLTHTMILICEIMTEEPDGGSAMIPLEIFNDMYTFLAAIDASGSQALKNYYFTDSLLALWRESAVKDEKERMVVKEESLTEEESAKTIESEEAEEEILEKQDSKDVISCPSIAGDDDYSMDYHVESSREISEEGNLESEEVVEEVEVTATGMEEGDVEAEVEEEEKGEEEEKFDDDVSGKAYDDDTFQKFGEEEIETESKFEEQEGKKEGLSEIVGGLSQVQSVDTIQEEPRRIEPDIIEDDRNLKEDLEKLHILQIEMTGETDTEVEKFKCRLIKEMPLTKSQQEAVLHFKDTHVKSELSSIDMGDEGGEEEEEETARKYEDVYVDRIPGIGSKVPQELVDAVCQYMKEVAALQHGMVMPRNVRHYNCPPLEMMEY